MAYFPMFIELTDCPCLVVGGGPVAWHKVCVLQDFGARVTVVAQKICHEIVQMPGVTWQEKNYEKTDLLGMRLVVAATSEENINHRVSADCRELGILVNVVDKQEDCDFIFPSYVKQEEVIAAFSSGGQSPLITQYLKKQNESCVTPFIGELSAWLGRLRPELKSRVHSTERRSRIYAKLLDLGIRKGRVPTGEETECVIRAEEVKDGSKE